MKQRSISIGLAIALMLLVVAGCAAGPNEARKVMSLVEHPAGFWLGLWHGIIAPFAFVISLFSSQVGVYEVNNTGHLYDFGFLLGIAATFGGGAKRLNGKKDK
jgi:hypothetical protein